MESRAIEVIVKSCLELIEKGLVQSAHDCSEGGLAIAVVESCFASPLDSLGATLNLESTLRGDTLLFGESQSRILISFPEEFASKIKDLALIHSVDFLLLGKTGGSHFTVNLNGREYINQEIEFIKNIWITSLGHYAGQTT